jgi:CVNH domain
MHGFLRATLKSVVLILPIAFALPAQAQQMSSYQDSCRHIRVHGATLAADCRRMDGSFNETAIEIRGIENIDGNLQFSSMVQPSSYQITCRHIRVTGATLTALCRRIDGTWNESSALIPGIANIDGNLQYQ